MGQQLPFGEWELFHHSPIFTLITILFKIASANLYKCLTKPNQNQQRGRRTSYTSTSNKIRKANFNHSFYIITVTTPYRHGVYTVSTSTRNQHRTTPRRLRRINIRTRDFVSRGTVLLVTTVEASDSLNAPAKPRKTPYAKFGNCLLESHSIQQEIRPIDITPKTAL